MKGASKDVQALVRQAKKSGWTAERTKRHIKLVKHGKAVFCPMTPSDWRSVKDVGRKMRQVEAGR